MMSPLSGAPFFSQTAAPAPAGKATRDAPRLQAVIEPGQKARTLSAGDKFEFGIVDSLSPLSLIGWVASAGYEQAVNGSPNYGTDRGAFGQRLGAAALRDTSEGIFSESIMAPILREDPRYYRRGPDHNFFDRVVYSVTRPLITRTDSGRHTINFALMSGTLGGAALTNAYYPHLNRGVDETLKTFGGSIGGSALGDFVDEFYSDVAGAFHHGK